MHFTLFRRKGDYTMEPPYIINITIFHEMVIMVIIINNRKIPDVLLYSFLVSVTTSRNPPLKQAFSLKDEGDESFTNS